MTLPNGSPSAFATQADRPDLRLVPAALATWLAAWCATFTAPQVSAGASCAAGLAALVLLRRAKLRRARRSSTSTASLVVAGALICAAGGGLAAAARVSAIAAGPLPRLAEIRAVATLDLVVTADPRPMPPRARGPGPVRTVIVVRARAERVAARGIVTGVRSPVVAFADDERWLTVLPSQVVRVSGRLAPAQPHDNATALLRVHGPPALAAGPTGLQAAAGELRHGLHDAVAGLPEAQRGLVPGLVVGDTTRMPPELVEDFRTAGLTHLTAVSGANITIVLAVVIFAGRWVGVRVRAVPLLGLPAMAGFLVLARPEPSLVRATAMGSVGLLALASGRRGRGLPILCAAVVLLIQADPWLSRSYGFALSVLATAGLLVLAPPWRDRLSQRLPTPVAAAVAVPAAAQVACAPVVAMLSAAVSVVAVPANLLAAPAVAPATVLGVLAALAAPVAPPAAHLFGQLAGLPAWWIVAVAERSAALPGAALPWAGGPGGALLLVVVMLASVALAPALRRHRAWVLPVAGAAFVVVVASRPVLPPVWPLQGWPPPAWLLVACDVGQGDALVLNAGRQAAVVVDAGPDPRAVDRCLRRLRVRTVPYLLLTHFHADHVEGMPGVLRGRTVAEVGVGPLPEPAVEAARVARWARVRQVPVTHAAVGEVRRAGALSWRVLWPVRIIRERSPPNNASLAILAERDGVSLLLTGDVESVAQRALRHAQPGLRADVLKVPHHGSGDQDPGFLRSVGARVAVVCVGAGNDYGHPTATTLGMLRSAGTRVLRTDLDGDVAVTGPVDRLRVVGRKGNGVAPELPTDSARTRSHGSPRGRRLRRRAWSGPSGGVGPPWHADRRCRRAQRRPTCLLR